MSEGADMTSEYDYGSFHINGCYMIIKKAAVVSPLLMNRYSPH